MKFQTILYGCMVSVSNVLKIPLVNEVFYRAEIPLMYVKDTQQRWAIVYLRKTCLWMVAADFGSTWYKLNNTQLISSRKKKKRKINKTSLMLTEQFQRVKYVSGFGENLCH